MTTMKTSLLNKTVFITGASSGIGKACAEQFSAQGAKLILTARRGEKLTKLTQMLQNIYKNEILTLTLDVQNKEAVVNTIQTLPDSWKNIDILINNAGLALTSQPFQNGRLEDWDTMIDTNLKGLLYVTHAILPTMLTRNAGHIINIGSIAGHDTYPGGNIYCATKHAVHSISQALRMDLLGKNIRVTEIAPGAVHTAFSEIRWNDKKRADDFYAKFTPLNAEDIADTILYASTAPLHVNISELIIMPTDQASAHHLHLSS